MNSSSWLAGMAIYGITEETKDATNQVLQAHRGHTQRASILQAALAGSADAHLGRARVHLVATEEEPMNYQVTVMFSVDEDESETHTQDQVVKALYTGRLVPEGVFFNITDLQIERF